MKVLLLYDYPPPPAGLATQGDLLQKGLLELGVETFAANFQSSAEKEWYYRWFKPDVVVGVGYWGYTPQLILHPRKFGVQPVPWLVADGYIANYREVLNDLPLILVTSNWVREVYMRDGINGQNIEVLPVGCDTDTFKPYAEGDGKLEAARELLGVSSDQLLIMTVGGDAASKGAQEVMRALALINGKVPDWKYVCKVWPQSRTRRQNEADWQLATELGIERKMRFITATTSRNIMPYLLGVCDIYAAPSRLEGFGMAQVEAGACGKSVIGIKAMGMLDTLVHGETALLANVGEEIVIHETVLGRESGFKRKRKIIFDPPRIAEYRANVEELASHLTTLMTNPTLRENIGKAGRRRVVERFDYRVVAKQFVDIIREKLGIE